MLELRFIREHLSLVREKIRHRGMEDTRIDEFAAVDQQRLGLLSRVESLRNKRNEASREIAQRKKQGGDAEQLMVEMRDCQPPGNSRCKLMQQVQQNHRIHPTGNRNEDRPRLQ